jgi:hypothetical protein
MSVRSRLSGKEYSTLDAFVSDLQAGVNDDIAAAIAPLVRRITNLENQVASSGGTVEGGATGGTTGGGTTSTTTYSISARWSGAIGLSTVPITINVNGTSFTAERPSLQSFEQRVPAGARVTISTPYSGNWSEGLIRPTGVAFGATSYSFTATRSNTYTVTLQPQ